MTQSAKTILPKNRSYLYVSFGVTFCFFISGASALFFQVLWIRLFSLIFGTTQFAMGTVIAGFLGGLGFGSWLISRKIFQIKRPLLWYGSLELFIGFYGLLFPYLCQWLIPLQQLFFSDTTPNFYVLSVIRLCFALLVLLPPTTAMGATLPILSQFCEQVFSRPIFGVTFLYSINTLGAALGALLSGLYFIPNLGLAKSNYVAVGSNFLILLLTVLLAKLSSKLPIQVLEKQSSPSLAKEDTEQLPKVLVGTVILCSMITLVLELIWSRVLEMILGSTVYVVSSILTAFICGLGIGSLFCSLFLGSHQFIYRRLGYVFLVATFFLFGSLYLLDELPLWLVVFFYVSVERISFYLSPLSTFSLPTLIVFCSFLITATLLAKWGHLSFEKIPFRYFLGIGIFSAILLFLGIVFGIKTLSTLKFPRIGEYFELFFLVKFLMVCCIILPPSIFFGMVFPLSISALENTNTSLRYQVGKLYFFSTLGCIIGSLAGGFFVIPLFGVKNTFFMVILVSLLIGLFHLYREKWQIGLTATILTIILLFLPVYFFSWPFKEHILSSGMIQVVHKIGPFTIPSLRKDFENFRETILSHKDGVTATITMKETEESRALKVNGKVDASTKHDMYTQTLLGHIPVLLSPSADKVLIIGYGSGVTVSSVLAHERVKKTTVVEIEQEVLNASHYFRTVQLEDPLIHPKVEIEVNDARNYLLLTPQKFNIIISEPSNPWMTGASKLFTQEFYQIAKSRLTSDGSMGAWIQMYGMDQNSLFILFETFQSVFPYVYLFHFHSDLLLLGRDTPIVISDELLTQRFIPRVQEDLFRLQIYQISDVLSYYVLSPEGFKQLLPKRYEVQGNPPLPFQAGDCLFSIQNKPCPPPEQWKSLNSQSVTVRYQRADQITQIEIPGDILARLQCKPAKPQINTDDLPIIEYQAPKNIFNKDHHLLKKWLNSVEGEANFPNFIRWNNITDELIFYETLFHNDLVQDNLERVRESIRWHNTIPERSFLAKQMQWKFYLWQKQHEKAKNVYKNLDKPIIKSSVENDIFYYGLLAKHGGITKILIKNFKKYAIWEKSPDLFQGLRLFLQLHPQQSLTHFQKWDTTRIDTPMEVFLFKAICFEKTYFLQEAKENYFLFIQKILNTAFPYEEFLDYLTFLEQNTSIIEVHKESQKLKKELKDLHESIKLDFSAKNDSKALQLLEYSFLKRPNAYLFVYSYLNALERANPDKSFALLEKQISQIPNFNLKTQLAFKYKAKGLKTQEKHFFQKAIECYEEAKKLTLDPWEHQELNFRIQLLKEKLR